MVKQLVHFKGAGEKLIKVKVVEQTTPSLKSLKEQLVYITRVKENLSVSNELDFNCPT